MTLIILLYALFASSFTIGKILVGYTNPIFLTGIRMLLSGIILLIYQYFFVREHFRFQKKDIWLYLQVILFGIYGNYILRFWALGFLPSSKTNFFYNFAPFFSSFYSYLLFNERMSYQKWIGLAIGLVGMIPILLNGNTEEALVTHQFFFISVPEIAVIISVLFHSYSWIVVRQLVRDHYYQPMMINSITMTCGGLLALVTSFFVEKYVTIADPTTFFGWLALVIIISNIICYTLYGHLLKTYTATFLSFAGFLSPVFGALYGWAFLQEEITWHFYISGIIVLTGLYIFYKDELEVSPAKQLAQI